MVLTLDVHGFLHGESEQNPTTHETELAALLATLSRGADRVAEKRREVDRDRDLSPTGRSEAKRRVGADWAAHAATLPGAATCRQLRRHCAYQSKQIRDRVWPPRAPDDMSDADVAAITREIRDRVNAEPDPLKRKFLLDHAAKDGDALYFRAILGTPRAFPLYSADAIAVATETYIGVAKGDGAGVQSLRKSEAELAAFDRAFSRAATIAGSSIDVGQEPAQPTIQHVEADG